MTGGELLLSRCGVTFCVHAGAVTVVARRENDGVHLDTIRAVAPIVDDAGLEEIAQQWVDQRIVATPAPAGQCDSCGIELAAEPAGDCGHLYRDAVVVSFSGAETAAAQDPAGSVAVICWACASSLCDTNPWIAALLGHRTDSAQADVPALAPAFVEPPALLSEVDLGLPHDELVGAAAIGAAA